MPPKHGSHPLKSDPTRLATVRRVFAADVRRRFAALRRSLRRLVVGEDAFDLSPASPLASRWRYLPDAGKAEAFAAWLDAEIQRLILAPVGGQDWWLKHVQAAYYRGVNRAFDDVRRPALRGTGEIAGARAEYLRRVLAGPPRSFSLTANARHSLRDYAGRFVNAKVLALSRRLAVELKGATDATAQKIARALLHGLDAGQTAEEIAGAIDDAVDWGMRRALLVATTELTRIHASAQLDGMEALGYDEVALVAEWTAQGDACPKCAEMDGQVFSLDDARGLIPLHPSCACCWTFAGDSP